MPAHECEAPAISEHADRRADGRAGGRASVEDGGKADIAALDTGKRFSSPRPVSQARVSGSGNRGASRVLTKPPKNKADELQEKRLE